MKNYIIALLVCTVCMSALALLYMATTPLLAKRYSAKGRYYAWLIVVIGMVIPFRPQFGNAFVKVTMLEVSESIIQIGNGTPIHIPLEGASVITPSAPTITWWQIAAIVWLAGMLLFLIYHAAKHIRFMRMARRWSERISDEQTLSLLQHLKAELCVSQKVDLYLCPCIGSPTMVGIVRPRILLPTMTLATDDLCFILKHELVHYIRKDLWYKSLILIATASHWFNPVAYLIARAVNVLCEESCDAEVVRSADSNTRQHYSEVIIEVVRYQSKISTALSTTFYGGKRGMKQRIFSIMDTNKKKIGVALICGALLIPLGTGFAFAATAIQSPASEDNASEVNQQYPVTVDGYTMISKYNEDTGQTYYSWDGGIAWFPTSDIEWWTYDEYKTWLDAEKLHLQELVGSEDKGWNPSQGWYTWTQADVDEMIALYEGTLEQLKNGIMVSKSAYSDENSVLFYDPKDIGTKGDFSMIIGLENGEEITFGPYDTKDELLSAVAPYCEEQVKVGNMTQEELGEILEKCKF